MTFVKDAVLIKQNAEAKMHEAMCESPEYLWAELTKNYHQLIGKVGQVETHKWISELTGLQDGK